MAPAGAFLGRRCMRNNSKRWHIQLGDEHWARFTYARAEGSSVRLLGSIARGAQIGALAETPEGRYVQVNGDHVTPLERQPVASRGWFRSSCGAAATGSTCSTHAARRRDRQAAADTDEDVNTVPFRSERFTSCFG